MHIVLIERQYNGHRPTYLYQYSRILIESGHNVSIICGDPQKCRMDINVEKQLPEVRVYDFLEYNSKKIFLSRFSFFNNYILWKRLKLSLKNIRNVDFVFFMYFDDFVFNFHLKHVNRLKVNIFLNKFILPPLLDNNLKIRWSGILFHPAYFMHIDFKYLRRSKFNRSIAVLDETYYFEYGARRKVVLPDITDEQKPLLLSELAENILEKAKGRKIISLLGSLEKRKGILPLLDVAKEIDSSKYFFLIAGVLDENYSDFELSKIKSASQLTNCYLKFDGIPTEYDFNSLVSISDIIYIVYINFFHSSNLLTKASLFEKPVLSLKNNCIGERVKRYGIGISISTSNVEEIRKSLEDFNINWDRSDSHFSDYFFLHSQKQLRYVLSDILEN